MSEHPKLHSDQTLVVEAQRIFGRVDYSPCNKVAAEFAKGFKKIGLSADDLKFIQSMGYCVLLQETYPDFQHIEFKFESSKDKKPKNKRTAG